MIESLTIEKKKSARQQIGEYLRDAILTGELKAGTKLPSTQAMAEQWGTQVANVHAALKPLVNEGLLRREPKIGTIVNDRKRELTAVGVFVCEDLRKTESIFLRLLVDSIENKLQEAGIECVMLYENKEKSGFKQASELASKRLIQGVILPQTDLYYYQKFKKLPVPFSCLSYANFTNRVSFDDKSLLDNALLGLKKQGCKKIGMLSVLRDYKSPKESGERKCNQFYSYLRRRAREMNLELRDKWIRKPGNKSIKTGEYCRFAYDSFKDLWQQEEKPDGLFVYTDTLTTGTLLSLLQMNIRVPENLKLVFHRNKDNNILCPVPCYYVENDIDEIACGLIKIVKDQFDGKEIIPINIDYSLRYHSGD